MRSPLREKEYYRRHLPHWQPLDVPVFLTWRLHGSLPKDVLAKLERERHWEARVLKAASDPRELESISLDAVRRRFRIVDRALDKAAFGPTWLKDPRIAAVTVETLRDCSAELAFFELCAFAVMPNHVHMLIRPKAPLARIMKSVKGFSARKANRILGREGEPFWQDESFDHWIRNSVELERTVRYIENNPVAAGLTRTPEDWPWSSATR